MAEGGSILPDEAATLAAGAALAPLLRAGDVVTLAGPLGSGKTTLARGLLTALGLAGDVPSPSFPIVIAYAPPELRLAVAHADLYRIEHAGEVEELGLDDALTDGALLVEWPGRAPGAWPQALALRLEPITDGRRRLTWAAGASWADRWPPDPR